MARDSNISIEGKAVQLLGPDMFKVSTHLGEWTAKVSGRLRKNKIRVVEGDTVEISVSPTSTPASGSIVLITRRK